MPNYTRLVSYIYNYEDGSKRNNVGYARVEARNGQCKCFLHIAAPSVNDKLLKAYMFRRREGDITGILLGTLQIRNGIGEFRVQTDSLHIMNSPYSINDMGGILLYLTDTKFFATEWDDIPITKETAVSIHEGSSEQGKKESLQEEVQAAESIPEVKNEPVYESPTIENLVQNIIDNKNKIKNPNEEDSFVSTVKENEPDKDSFRKNEDKAENEEPVQNIEPKESSVFEYWEKSAFQEVWDEKKKEDLEEIQDFTDKNNYSEQDNTSDTVEFNDKQYNLFCDNSSTCINADNSDTYFNKFNSKTGQLDNTYSRKEQREEKEQKEQREQIEQNEPRLNNKSVFEDHPLALRIYRNYPRMYPFEDNDVAWCVRIEPQDIGLFPMEAWVLGNNSFLLHGYYSYRHLIFARINDRNGMKYILGVPGIYHNREKFMAKMFGFDNFKCVKRKELKTGEFGYWYIPVILS